MKELSKRFNHEEEESLIYSAWKKSGYFTPEKCVESGVCEANAEPFSIVLPPPNVTGTLHMGHATMLVLEDIMVRFARMNGKKTVWIPGTDHAAIATQSKVEKELYKKEGKNRHDLGREKFLRHVEAFASESHDTIVNQISAMGASVDWSREAFTLDEPRSLAVRTAFKKMYDAGLIYRKNKVVNWDPKGQTVVSDDEVEHEEAPGTLYTFKYSADFPIPVATTRPETKVGDTAVAVNPKDKRYEKYIGQEFTVSDFAGAALKIKIIADDSIDPEFGTGAIGVTPAHSQADWDIAERHGLPMVQVINEYAKMTEEAGRLLEGKKVKEAREEVVSWLEKNNLLEKAEEIIHNISRAERSGGVIEPLPKLQWFVAVNKPFPMGPSKIKGIKEGDEVTLKQLMKKVVENNQINIIPDRFVKEYFRWIDNLHDWCISRQIWYGHRLPVWYQGEKIYVGLEAPTSKDWEQDPDTLDTWFSSSLWTFSTLGWPNDTPDLKTFHPTTVLETGYDILFFWIARMVLMSAFILGEVPFKTVYLHGLVRDSKGRKMSKSLGNGIDPLDMISKYGADATRLSLVTGVTPGNDLNLSEEKVRAFRNFSTKIWNATRFLLMNRPSSHSERSEESRDEAIQKHLSRLAEVKKEITTHYEKYEFHLAGEKAYAYFWNEFANGILEEYKNALRDGSLEEKRLAYYLLETILHACLKLLHPFIPFVTEACYQELKNDTDPEFLLVSKW